MSSEPPRSQQLASLWKSGLDSAGKTALCLAALPSMASCSRSRHKNLALRSAKRRFAWQKKRAAS